MWLHEYIQQASKANDSLCNYCASLLRCFVMTRNATQWLTAVLVKASVSAAEHTQTIKELSQVAHEHWLDIIKHG
jgi:hypothetical protein